MQCRSRPSGVSATRSPRNSTKFSERVESVTHPATSPSWTFEPGEEHPGAVAVIAVVPSRRGPRPGRLRRVDPRLGLDPGLLVHRPHHGVGGRVQVEAAHVRGFLPEVGVVAGHPRLDLPRLEIQARADPPHCDAEIGTPWSAIASASASIVQRVASSGGGSVTSFTSSSTSSWS